MPESALVGFGPEATLFGPRAWEGRGTLLAMSQDASSDPPQPYLADTCPKMCISVFAKYDNMI